MEIRISYNDGADILTVELNSTVIENGGGFNCLHRFTCCMLMKI